MPQSAQPNGCLSLLILIVADFVVLYIGSSIWEGVFGKPEKEWTCWSEIDQDFIQQEALVN